MSRASARGPAPFLEGASGGGQVLGCGVQEAVEGATVGQTFAECPPPPSTPGGMGSDAKTKVGVLTIGVQVSGVFSKCHFPLRKTFLIWVWGVSRPQMDPSPPRIRKPERCGPNGASISTHSPGLTSDRYVRLTQ